MEGLVAIGLVDVSCGGRFTTQLVGHSPKRHATEQPEKNSTGAVPPESAIKRHLAVGLAHHALDVAAFPGRPCIHARNSEAAFRERGKAHVVGRVNLADGGRPLQPCGKLLLQEREIIGGVQPVHPSIKHMPRVRICPQAAHTPPS